MAHFASLLFSEDGLVINNSKGLSLEMTWMRCPVR